MQSCITVRWKQLHHMHLFLADPCLNCLEGSTVRSCGDFSNCKSKTKLNEFLKKKKTWAWGRIASLCKGYRGGLNINRHPLAKLQGPEEPLPRRTDKAHEAHVLGEGKKQQQCQDFSLLGCSGAMLCGILCGMFTQVSGPTGWSFSIVDW